jgi:hypothetical protein
MTVFSYIYAVFLTWKNSWLVVKILKAYTFLVEKASIKRLIERHWTDMDGRIRLK